MPITDTKKIKSNLIKTLKITLENIEDPSDTKRKKAIKEFTEDYILYGEDLPSLDCAAKAGIKIEDVNVYLSENYWWLRNEGSENDSEKVQREEQEFSKRDILDDKVRWAVFIEHIVMRSRSKFQKKIEEFQSYIPFIVSTNYENSYLPPALVKIIEKFYVDTYNKTYNVPSHKDVESKLGMTFDIIQKHFGKKQNFDSIIFARTGCREKTLAKKNMAVYANACKKENKYLDENEFRSIITEDDAIKIFRIMTFHEFKNKSLERHKPKFTSIDARESFTSEEYKQSLTSLVTDEALYIIAGSMPNAKIHPGFMKAIALYQKKNGAKLIAMPTDGSYAWHHAHRKEIPGTIVAGDLHLNKHLVLLMTQIKATQNPRLMTFRGMLTGSESGIIASTRQLAQFFPRMKDERYTKTIYSTGSFNIPKYSDNVLSETRNQRMAESLHKTGALIAEIKGGLFQLRTIEWREQAGCFTDLGYEYHADGKIVKAKDCIASFGDAHYGEHDPLVLNAFLRMADYAKVNRIYLQDLLDFLSINHHQEDNILHQYRMHKLGTASLEEEMNNVIPFLNDVCSKYEVKIVPSNHEKFIEKALASGRLGRDPINYHILCQLATWASSRSDDGSKRLWNDPCEKYFSERLEHPEKLEWLVEDRTVKEHGWLVNDHGHKGSNGTRGNFTNFERSGQRRVVGHSHTPQIGYYTIQSGYCGRYIRGNEEGFGYATGESSWMESSVLIYPDGSAQLINIIDNKFSFRHDNG